LAQLKQNLPFLIETAGVADGKWQMAAIAILWLELK
jgi:hypothetical protein